MKRSIAAFLICFSILVLMLPARTFAEEEQQVYGRLYESKTDIMTTIRAVGFYANWDGVTNAAQFLGPNGCLCFAVNDTDKVTVYLTDNQSILGTVELEKQHPLFGTVVADQNGNFYLITGEENTTDDMNAETIFISKYNSEGTHLQTVGDDGSSSLAYYYPDNFHTKIPFNGGNCDAAISGNLLAVNYARKMYNGHQSNSVFMVNINDLSEVYPGLIYQSHSFAQRVIATSDGFIFAGEGDAYNRAFSIYTLKTENDRVVSLRQDDIFHFWIQQGASNNMFIVNENFARMGGLASFSDGRAAFVALSAPSLNEEAEREAKGLFVQIFDSTIDASEEIVYTTTGTRSGLSSMYGNEPVTDYGVQWLTSLKGHEVSQIQVVGTDDDRVVILYEYDTDYMGVFCIVLDSNGNVLSEPHVLSPYSRLNPCETPVYSNGRICWIGNSEEANSKSYIHLYSLDLDQEQAITQDPQDTAAVSGETVTLNVETNGTGYTYKWEYSENGYFWYGISSADASSNSISFTMSDKLIGYQYRCVVKDSAGGIVVSKAAKLSWNNRLKVWADGAEQISEDEYAYTSEVKIKPGSSADLLVHVEAAEMDGLVYGWSKAIRHEDGLFYYDESFWAPNRNTLTIAEPTPDEFYECHVFDKYNNVQGCRFTFKYDNSLKAWPEGAELDASGNYKRNVTLRPMAGASVDLAVNITADDESQIAIKWYKNVGQYNEATGLMAYDYAEIVGATGRTLHVPAPDKDEDYLCEVSDQFGNTILCFFKIEPEVEFKAWPKGAEIMDDGEHDVQIILQPKVGETVELSVEVSVHNKESISYQWYSFQPIYKNGVQTGRSLVAMTGETGSSITVTVGDQDADYACMVTDPFGSMEMCTFMIRPDFNFQVWPEGAEQKADGKFSQTVDVAVEFNTNRTLKVVSNFTPASYVWYDWSVSSSPLAASGPEYTAENVRSNHSLECVVTDPKGNEHYLSFNLHIFYYDASHIASVGAVENAYSEVYADINSVEAESCRVYVKEGDEIVLNVNTKPEGIISYYWYRNGFGISDEEGPSLAVKVQDVNDLYYCWVFNGYNGALIGFHFAEATEMPLTILTQPEDVTAAVGETVRFTVKASDANGPLTYQWYYASAGSKTFKALSGKTAATYSFKLSESNAGRRVYCIVTDAKGNTVQSQTAAASLLAAPVVFAITKEPESMTAEAGTSVTFKVEATGEGLTYQWYYAKAGSKSFKALSGKTTEKYTLKLSETNAGRQVYCIVTDANGNTLQSKTVTASLPAEPVEFAITKDPESVTAEAGTKVTFKVEATGEGLTYQWYYANAGSKSFKALSGKTAATYSFTLSETNAGRRVYCIVTDKNGNTLQSETASASLPAEPVELAITKEPESVTAAAGTKVTFSVEATGNGLTYQWYYANAGAKTFKALSGKTAATYSFSLSETNAGRRVYCIVKDADENTVQSQTAVANLQP